MAPDGVTSAVAAEPAAKKSASGESDKSGLSKADPFMADANTRHEFTRYAEPGIGKPLQSCADAPAGSARHRFGKLTVGLSASHRPQAAAVYGLPMSKPPPPNPPQVAKADRHLALRVVTMPKDTNQYGTIFGGVILSYIDQAGFVQARRHGNHRWVTVAMDRVEFKQPVQLGDVVNFYAFTVRTGKTSVTVEVDVEAERYSTGATVPVTSATLVMVSVDAAGKAIPFASSSST